MMSVSSRFCSIWKMRSCFRRPEEPSILSPSAISWSSDTDFRFNSAISTLWGEEKGRSLLKTPSPDGARKLVGSVTEVLAEERRRVARQRAWFTSKVTAAKNAVKSESDIAHGITLDVSDE